MDGETSHPPTASGGGPSLSRRERGISRAFARRLDALAEGPGRRLLRRRGTSVSSEDGARLGAAAGAARAGAGRRSPTAACQRPLDRRRVRKARTLGAEARALAWTGFGHVAGLPAAARRAPALCWPPPPARPGPRSCCWDTASDLAERGHAPLRLTTVPVPRMGAVAGLARGRDIFLLRPLLSLTRGEIRAALTADGETWLEDPANTDLRYARARARASADPSKGRPGAGSRGRPPPIFSIDAAGAIRPPRDVAAAHLAAALLCAAGTERPPRGEQLERPGPAPPTWRDLHRHPGRRADRGGRRGADLSRRRRDGARRSRASGAGAGRDGRLGRPMEITAGAEPLTISALKGQVAVYRPSARVSSSCPPPPGPACRWCCGGAAPCSPALDGPDFAAEGEGARVCSFWVVSRPPSAFMTRNA